MNSSQQRPGTIPADCREFRFVDEVPRNLSTLPYSIRVINIVILVTTCPFTSLLNALVMITVKIRARLQSMSNIAPVCLAASDAMVGICVQPLCISYGIVGLQGEYASVGCPLQNALRYLMNFFCFSSIAHLELMTEDRYMAIKNSYIYQEIFTKSRLLIVSAIAWIATAVVHITLLIKQNIFIAINSAVLVAFSVFVILCNVVVYRETRRHERQITEQLVSVETKEKEKRALKITTTIVVVLILCYTPMTSLRVLKDAVKDTISVNAFHAMYFSGGSLVLINSLLNPLIYSVRLRRFRVAFIELLLKKTSLKPKSSIKKYLDQL